MDAIKFIIAEHNMFKRRFAKISKTANESTKKRLFNILGQSLIRHETMEQKVWYPNFKTDPLVKPTVKHLVTEEKTAATVIKELLKKPLNSAWLTKFQKLKIDVIKHATEEQTKLFPKVRKILDQSELNLIGKRLRAFKKRYKY